MGGFVVNDEYISEFVEEAICHVETFEAGLLALENGADDPEIVNSIFRAVHSIKGTAGFFALHNIVELSHVMENLLGLVRAGQLLITSPMIDDLLQANDCLKEMVIDLAESENRVITSFISRLNEYATGTPAMSDTVSAAQNPARFSLSLSSEQRSLIADAVASGHTTYAISLHAGTDLIDRGIDPLTWIEVIPSIGNMIAIKPPLTNQTTDEWDNVSFSVYFTSVMDTSLVAMALDVPEEQINIWKLDDANEADEDQAVPFRDNQVPFSPEALSVTPLEAAPEPAVDSRPTDPQPADAHRKQNAASIEESIRVAVPLLNNLLDLTSEMVLGRNQLLRILDSQKKVIPGLDTVLQNIDHLTTELQDKVMHTRMQPLGNVFNKFPRLVRELSKKLAKDVELEMDGTDVELDKSIIEALADPMTHLIRNALDHGVESPAEREAAGKPKMGRISINAYHEAGHVNIDITDDGAGISARKVGKSAVSKGLVTETDISYMRESELLNLIFLPGFSTTEQVTDVSGRGVGMDVVKTNIEKLGGTIETYTSVGQGTTFRLVMPLTLAIIPSLIVEVRGQKFALPQVNLQEMVRIKPGDASRRIEYVHDAPVLRLRGKLLPLVYLAEVLGLAPARDIPSGSNHSETGLTVPDADPMVRILVLKMGLRRYGLVVDSIDDGEEILVKPLPRFLKDCACYSGVTILGDGRTALILDPDGISVKANLHYLDDQLQALQNEQRSAEMTNSESQNLLLFGGAGSEIFAIDMSMVLRVEQIHHNQIEYIGTREYLPFRQQSLRLLRLEDYLPVQRTKPDPERMFVIIPKLVAHPIGILVHGIHDTIVTSIRLNPEDMKAKGLIGSCMHNDHMVLLINIYELLELAAPEWYGPQEIPIHFHSRKALVVEDTPFFARMEQHFLEWAGFEVFAAANGRDAMEILQKETVDIVISDIQMPIMDGYELLKCIRSDPQLSRVPVIAVTSMTDEVSRKRGLEAGFDSYENKLDKATLLNKVEAVLAGKRDAI